ncbi:MAG: LysR family transcriptional regulator [Thermoanaerobaculia bacterium]|nr:LysR family transcriptional regulator [Thermoanaerobaculia bacterium]
MESRDLNLLLALDALLQEANVTLAARRLGLSTPAASHALARIRERLDDPILVRAGRKMVLTPRAESLRPQVRSLVEETTRVLSAAVPFSPRQIARTFTVHTTDHVLMVLGPALDRVLRDEAPDVSVRYLPSAENDWIPLREGAADLSVCILGHFPPEFRTRRLFTDRFVCAVREDHPRVGKRLTLDEYLALDHVVVSPLGRKSAVDAALAERGLERRVRRVVPFFSSGLLMAATTDYILTVSDRAASTLAPRLGLRLLEPPLPLAPYALNLLWHPRLENEPANRWLREVFIRAAREAVPDSALEAGDAPARPPRRGRPTSGSRTR